VLEWALNEKRIVLTHDVATITGFAFERILNGLAIPGVIEVRRNLPIGIVIDDIVLLTTCGYAGEYEGKVTFLPLR
jgi:hypothetical protein